MGEGGGARVSGGCVYMGGWAVRRSVRGKAICVCGGGGGGGGGATYAPKILISTTKKKPQRV